MTARERINSLADPESFRETNQSITSLDPLSFSSRIPYKQRIFRDQRRTGLTEAVVTGICEIGGTKTTLIVLDFGFMGGTMGCVVGEKISLALERSVKLKIPAVSIVTSGGTRVQEGILSLMQMAKTVMASNIHSEAGLPFISVLANPTTGQAYASFANLADIIIGEPGAVVGFSPSFTQSESPKDQVSTRPLTTESQVVKGMLDAVVDRTSLKDLLATILDLLGQQYQLTSKQKIPAETRDLKVVPAWEAVQLSRHQDRPSSVDYITRILTNFVELHGDRINGDDLSTICGFGQLGGQTIMVIGNERYRENSKEPGNSGRTTPEGFRKAQRIIHMASKFNIPILCLVDTPGPDTSLSADQRGLSNTIATTISKMASAQVPSISVVIGEGGNASALAFGITDRVFMQENAIYTTVAPEDAAQLIYQDKNRAEEVSESLRLTAQDCLELGIADGIVQEPPGGAHNNPDEAARQLRRVLLRELSNLQSGSQRRRVREKNKKFRKMGEYSSYFRTAITREVNSLQGFVSTKMRSISQKAEKDTE